MNVTIYSMLKERDFIPFPGKKIFTLLKSLTGLPLCHSFTCDCSCVTPDLD